MVVSYAGSGTVYSFRPDSQADQITVLHPEPAVPRPGMTAVLPTDEWLNDTDFKQHVTSREPFQYVSPDGSTFLPADETFTQGKLYYGTKMADLLRAFGLSKTQAGQPFYISDETAQKTYSAQVESDGRLSELKLFAELGGESVATDSIGNVYVAAGQIFVYDSKGSLIDTIAVPERPINLVFGGKDGRTLFILARTSLYSVLVQGAGRKS